MANEKNVAALADLLEATSVVAAGDVQGVAEFLASKGVLVPSVLNVDQVAAIFDVPERDDFRDMRVRLLQKVAKGEYHTARERLAKGDS